MEKKILNRKARIYWRFAANNQLAAEKKMEASL